MLKPGNAFLLGRARKAMRKFPIRSKNPYYADTSALTKATRLPTAIDAVPPKDYVADLRATWRTPHPREYVAPSEYDEGRGRRRFVNVAPKIMITDATTATIAMVSW